ncbi:MAG TPA: potassium transporter [Anaeromyxobacteraceae bacterium]|nr:potassium transporter [Anaeromyxobacteraceae bacterium]
MSEPLEHTRVVGGARTRVVATGLRRRPLRDLYHHLLSVSWLRLFWLFGLVYVAVNLAFAAGYHFLGAAPPASFLDDFLASLRRTIATNPRPPEARTLAVEVLLGVEGFVRWLGLALGAGIIFAKFSSPRPGVVFSRLAVVAPRGGARALMFRMANERQSPLVDAKLRVLLVMNERNADGDLTRRIWDVPLKREETALFTHAWTAIHPIDASSPLAGEDGASLEAADAELIVSLTGFDEGLSRTVHARHAWRARDIGFGLRFREMVKVLPSGVHQVDYRRFHEVEPAEDRTARPQQARRRD